LFGTPAGAAQRPTAVHVTGERRSVTS
jgi:hypothetical protein